MKTKKIKKLNNDSSDIWLNGLLHFLLIENDFFRFEEITTVVGNWFVSKTHVSYGLYYKQGEGETTVLETSNIEIVKTYIKGVLGKTMNDKNLDLNLVKWEPITTNKPEGVVLAAYFDKQVGWVQDSVWWNDITSTWNYSGRMHSQTNLPYSHFGKLPNPPNKKY